jgi:hypothetical protein
MIVARLHYLAVSETPATWIDPICGPMSDGSRRALQYRPMHGLPMIAAMFAALPGLTLAQEYNIRDPGVIEGGVKRATLIVVGTFRAPWCVPWFNGWHCSGGIEVDEILSGNFAKGGTVPFRWEESFFRGDSGVCYRFADLRGKLGIWLLSRDSRMQGGWRIENTVATFCAGPLSIDCRNLVRKAISKNASATAER